MSAPGNSAYEPWGNAAPATPLANARRSGLMSKADKAIFDTATSNPTASSIAYRNANGIAYFSLEAATAPTLLNSWANVGGIYGVAGYYKDNQGQVKLQGVIKRAAGAPAAASAILTLPVGYRPPASRIFTVSTGSGTGQVEISAGGDVLYALGTPTVLFSLDDIPAFRTT